MKRNEREREGEREQEKKVATHNASGAAAAGGREVQAGATLIGPKVNYMRRQHRKCQRIAQFTLLCVRVCV